jgi:hypothetical protein
MINQCQRVQSSQPTQWAVAVDGVFDLAVRSQDEASGVNIAFFFIEKRACLGSEIARIQPISHGKSKHSPFCNFLSIFQALDGGSNDPDISRFVLHNFPLEISKLLMAEGSPSATVYEHDAPLTWIRIWQYKSAAVYQL